MSRNAPSNITAGGKNVAPAPLEDRNRAHPLVGQCMVVGDHRPYVAVLITLDPDGREHWRSVHKREPLRLTSSMKLTRKMIATEFAKETEGLYERGGC